VNGGAAVASAGTTAALGGTEAVLMVASVALAGPSPPLDVAGASSAKKYAISSGQ